MVVMMNDAQKKLLKNKLAVGSILPLSQTQIKDILPRMKKEDIAFWQKAITDEKVPETAPFEKTSPYSQVEVQFKRLFDWYETLQNNNNISLEYMRWQPAEDQTLALTVKDKEGRNVPDHQDTGQELAENCFNALAQLHALNSEKTQQVLEQFFPEHEVAGLDFFFKKRLSDKPANPVGEPQTVISVLRETYNAWADASVKDPVSRITHYDKEINRLEAAIKAQAPTFAMSQANAQTDDNAAQLVQLKLQVEKNQILLARLNKIEEPTAEQENLLEDVKTGLVGLEKEIKGRAPIVQAQQQYIEAQDAFVNLEEGATAAKQQRVQAQVAQAEKVVQAAGAVFAAHNSPELFSVRDLRSSANPFDSLKEGLDALDGARKHAFMVKPTADSEDIQSAQEAYAEALRAARHVRAGLALTAVNHAKDVRSKLDDLEDQVAEVSDSLQDPEKKDDYPQLETRKAQLETQHEWWHKRHEKLEKLAALIEAEEELEDELNEEAASASSLEDRDALAGLLVELNALLDDMPEGMVTSSATEAQSSAEEVQAEMGRVFGEDAEAKEAWPEALSDKAEKLFDKHVNPTDMAGNLEAFEKEKQTLEQQIKAARDHYNKYYLNDIDTEVASPAPRPARRAVHEKLQQAEARLAQLNNLEKNKGLAGKLQELSNKLESQKAQWMPIESKKVRSSARTDQLVASHMAESTLEYERLQKRMAALLAQKTALTPKESASLEADLKNLERSLNIQDKVIKYHKTARTVPFAKIKQESGYKYGMALSVVDADRGTADYHFQESFFQLHKPSKIVKKESEKMKEAFNEKFKGTGYKMEMKEEPDKVSGKITFVLTIIGPDGKPVLAKDFKGAKGIAFDSNQFATQWQNNTKNALIAKGIGVESHQKPRVSKPTDSKDQTFTNVNDELERTPAIGG